MKDALATLSEDQLRRFVGEAAIDRAARHLLTGKVQERLHWANGDIEAYWDTRLDEILMHAENRKQGIAFNCTCGELDKKPICEHVIAMLLAWVTDPGSFGIGPEDDDELYTIVDEDFLDFPRPTRISMQEATPQQEYLRLLSGLTVHELREIARYRGIAISGNRKEPILQTLAEALSDIESIEEAWAGLSPEARLVAGILPFVQSSENLISRIVLLKAAQKWGLHSEEHFQQALVDLKLAGLAFTFSSGMIGFLSWLDQLLPADPAFTPAFGSVDSQGDIERARLKPEPAASPLEFMQGITRLLLILEAGGDRFKASPKQALHPVLQKYTYMQGWPYDRRELDALGSEKNLAQALWTRSFRISAAPSPLAQETRRSLSASLHLDEPELDFAFHLLEGEGILSLKEGQPVRVDKEKAAEWLHQEPLERAGSILTAYANMETWTDFDLVFGSQPDFAFRRSQKYSSVVSYQHMLALLATCRRNLLYQVRRQPAGRWADFEAFLERARLLPNVINTFTVGAPWFFELKGRKLDLGKLEDWKAFYGLFAEAVLHGPLSWQGLVEVAYRDKRLVAFRLTEYGAALLLQKSEYQFQPPERSAPVLEYARDGSLLLHPETAGSELLKLLSVLGEARLADNGALAYHLSAAGAAGAFTAGWTLDQVQALLRDSAGASLPAGLSASLQKWWQEYGSLHIYEDIALVELADDYALNELLAGTSLSRYLLYRFTPRLVAVRPEGVDLLREELVKKGYTPKISGA